GGTPPTFTLDSAYWITEIWTYHWNNGQGAPSVGNITVQSADGQTYGPFQCEGRSTNNVYWVATLNQTLPAGNYTIIDSDPNTLAQNAATNGQGHAWAYGIKNLK
ncbi:MAG TPA: hypothetical protein PL066_03620, partial [bacterium]|nr:hypothetical protein [bacterium]